LHRKDTPLDISVYVLHVKIAYGKRVAYTTIIYVLKGPLELNICLTGSVDISNARRPGNAANYPVRTMGFQLHAKISTCSGNAYLFL
jgi:hypothetical protein